jgi:hypothetical protein
VELPGGSRADYAGAGSFAAALKLGPADECAREADALRLISHLPNMPRLGWAGPTTCGCGDRAWAVVSTPVGTALQVAQPMDEAMLLQVFFDLLTALADLASLGTFISWYSLVSLLTYALV